MSKLTVSILTLVGVLVSSNVAASVRVAVAANFKPTLDILIAAYHEKQPEVQIQVSSASTGVLYAQIKRGAPFDLFLSADSERPKQLEIAGNIIPGSRHTYALGQLVLWHKGAEKVNAQTLDHLSGKLAMANPALAPFGLAAQQTLEKLGKYQSLKQRIVLGNNVSHVAQYVQTGAASSGFVALSQVLNKGQSHKDYWLVPQRYFQQIEQQLVMIKQAKRQTQARKELDDFHRFIMSAAGQRIISTHGYQSAVMQYIPRVGQDVQ